MSRVSEGGSRKSTTRFHCAVAWTGRGFEKDVVVGVGDGLIVSLEVGVTDKDPARLPGVVFPGMVNNHSHVFHRLLRGHVSRRRGDFWSWREAMYEVAEGLDPDSYRQIAAATFREMLAAGYTSVTEFHYLHHQPDGRPYDEPNVMGDALADAAAEVGVRLTLLDTCYLSSGFGLPPAGVQRRFSDGTPEAWAERVAGWQPPSHVQFGAAIHSVRAVNPRQMSAVAEWAEQKPLHIHVSEQPAENKEALNHYGRTPVQVLADGGLLGPTTTVVHATHASDDDIALLSESETSVVICPTTERWLADGIGPTGALGAAGIELTIGSDSQAVIDPWEEMRLLELHQRLATGTTEVHGVPSLLQAGSGGRRLGVGEPADLVAVATDTPRTAGVPHEGIVFCATAADVAAVVVGGRTVSA
ncbi:MAG TPA: formimidoylglutamate deiminase [Acidimicrobiia bacterium]|nr:formimidoylglutamate deiminase [Acidimicrobiia bacterium]